MGFFDRLFSRNADKKQEQVPAKVNSPNITTTAASQKKNEVLMQKYEQARTLFVDCLKNYHSTACACAYPRFQQIIGIDCHLTGGFYKCLDTDLLIDLSARYFDIGPSDLNDENSNERWICKTCGSVYEYGWSDFSIHVERQKLKLILLKTNLIGKPVVNPIPLFLGLFGHAYPPKTEMRPADLEEFETYLSER